MEWVEALPVISSFISQVGVPVIITLVVVYIAYKLSDKLPSLIAAYTDQVSTLNKLVDNNTKAVEGVTQAVNGHKELLAVHHDNAIKMKEEINTLSERVDDLTKDITYVRAKVERND